KVALTTFILSHLYRGSRSLVTRGFGPAGGPFWILQLWLQSYFPQYRPLPYDKQNYTTLGIALDQGKLKQNSFRECFKFFYSCSSISPSQFTPYSPGWLKLPVHIPSSKLALDDIWSSFLIPRDLQYGLAIGNSSVGKAGVEYYSPNQFAREEAIKKRRNKDSISRQGQEKDKRPSKNANRELILPNIKHYVGVPGSSHSSVNHHEKSVANEATLPIYAESPDLSVEKARNLEELRGNLPSLLANFQDAKKQKDEYSQIFRRQRIRRTSITKRVPGR
ncbi:hypothetical protein MTR67_025538, partial [Solanum verrucosum]